jgi:hypothetical protein
MVHAACLKNAYKILFRKLEGKRPLGRARNKYGSIKLEWDGMGT